MLTFEEYISNNILSKTKEKFPEIIIRMSGVKEDIEGGNRYTSLDMILVPYNLRNQGIGTKVMKFIVSMAKKEKIDVFLTPDDTYQEKGDMTKKDLEKWYKKLGFKKKEKSDFRSQHTMCLYT